MSEFQRFFEAIRFADVFDVLVVALLIYLVVRWLLHRASWAVAVGVTIILVLYVAAEMLSMYLTLAVFRAGAVLLVVVMAIVFQDDIRRGIERIAAWRPGPQGGRPRPLQGVQDTLVESLAELSQRKLGALIVLLGREPLEAHVRGGVPLNGQLSFPLLLSIFDHKTPGHDGAVILDGRNVVRFGAHLPLSKNLEQIGGRGTRHAAALGLSEACDALVIVLSEERGTITVAERGVLDELGSPAELSRRVDSFHLEHGNRYPHAKGSGRAVDWTLRAAALMVACLLWGIFAYRVDRVERVIENVPVEYRSLPPGWQVEHIAPAAVQLTLSGPERAFDRLDQSTLRVSLDLEKQTLRTGRQEFAIDSRSLNLPQGVGLAPGDIPSIVLVLERMVTINAQVRPRLVGSVPESHRVQQVRLSPDTIRITASSRQAPRAKTLYTEPIRLDGMLETFSRQIQVQLPDGVGLTGDSVNAIDVTVEIVPAE